LADVQSAVIAELVNIVIFRRDVAHQIGGTLSVNWCSYIVFMAGKNVWQVY